MKTSKAFSTISYNTPDFLAVKLDELVQRRVISFYAFVYHYKEDDERKDHIHLYIEPNGQYQTDSLSDYLLEPDFTNLAAPPLGIMPCKSSKFGDWFLYTCHDAAYLASKGQSRSHHYDTPDFRTSNSDYLLEQVHTIDRSPYKKTQEFVKAVKDGTSLFEMVSSGQVPIHQFNQWASMYEYVQSNGLFRNGKRTHTPIIDDSNPGMPKQLVMNSDGSTEWWYIDPSSGELLEPVDEQ